LQLPQSVPATVIPPANRRGSAEAARPVVHRLRLCPVSEEPAFLVPTGAAGLAPGLAERIGRLAESGTPRVGPVLTYSRLPEGGSVLCRLSPVATASAGVEPCLDVRVAVLPEGAAHAGLTPIEAWPEDCWPQLGRGHRPRGVLGPRLWIDRAELIGFAAEVRGRLSCVLADVRELFTDRAGPQILLVERSAHDVARWIALICASVPPQLARELTFTTSATRPYAAFEQIVGVPPEAEFAFSEVELRHLYRVRSAEGRCSPDSADPWAEIAARLWQHGRPELIHDTARIPAGAPFDAGRLAAVALIERLPVGREAELLAAAWISRPANTGAMAQPDLDSLMDALTQIDRAAVGTAEPHPAPAALRQVLRAFHSLKRRATPEAAAPVALSLGRAALHTALGRCAEVRADPLADLGIGRSDRGRLAQEFRAEVLAVLSSPSSTPAALQGGLVLARALGLDPAAADPSGSARLAVRLGTVGAQRGRLAHSIIEFEQTMPDTRPALRESVLCELADRLAYADADELLCADAVTVLCEAFEGELLPRYVRVHDVDRARALAALILRNPGHAAGRFYVWSELAAAGHEQTRRVGRRLIDRFIVPAVLREDRTWLAAVGERCGRIEGVAERWDRLVAAWTGSTPTEEAR
jgi:hypothetical protein